MLYRKALEDMLEWQARKTHQGLLVTGARQVGKTTLVREFARTRYKALVEINFLETPDATEVISRARNADDLLLRISALTDRELVPKETLVFFDEIQEFGDILTWSKFLQERTEYDYVFSGSLLGIDLFNIRSWPVGFLDVIEMHPLTFEEFCLAANVAPRLLDEARNSFAAQRAVPDFIHEKLLDLYAKYLLIGGMPDAVQQYASTNDLTAVRHVHGSIHALYEYDITRHMQDNEGMRFAKAVYEAIPSQLDKENKRFKFTHLKSPDATHKGELRFSRLETAFDWLEHAGVALPAFRVDEPRYPLALNSTRSSFKLYLNDIGLLSSRTTGNADLAILSGRRDINYGSLYENAVAQELRACGHDLYYYNNTRRGEVDFVVQDTAQGSCRIPA